MPHIPRPTLPSAFFARISTAFRTAFRTVNFNSPVMRRLRLITGVILIVVGIPLYILPIPLGLVLLVPGLYLTLGASSHLRRKLVKLRRAYPRIFARLRPLLMRRTPARRGASS